MRCAGYERCLGPYTLQSISYSQAMSAPLAFSDADVFA